MTDRHTLESTWIRVGLGWPTAWTGLPDIDVPRGTPGQSVGLGWPSGHRDAQENAA